MIARRNLLKAGLALLAALPLVKLGNGEVKGQEPPRAFEDQEPYGFQPPHQKCKKFEKDK